MTLVLATAPHGFRSRHIEGKLNYVPTIMDDLGALLQKRLDDLSEAFDGEEKRPDFDRELLDEFCLLAQILWGRELLRAKWRAGGWVRHDVSLFDIANESIRIALAMIRDSTIRVQHRIRSLQLSYEMYNKKYGDLALRSRMIEWLFRDSMKSEQLADLVEGERSDVEGGVTWCCTHRMILTVLYNEVLKEYRQPGKYPGHMRLCDLERKLHRVVNFQPAGIKKNLEILFADGRFENELIRIQNAGASEGQEKARVHITRRGVAFFLSIMQTPDYWRLPGARFASDDDYWPIQEMDVADALGELESLCSRLRGVVKRHRSAWIQILCRRPGLYVNDEVTGFPFYEEEGFTLGTTFYLERVLESHIAATMDVVWRAVSEVCPEGGALKNDLDELLITPVKNGAEGERRQDQEKGASDRKNTLDAALRRIEQEIYQEEQSHSKKPEAGSGRMGDLEHLKTALLLGKQFEEQQTELRNMKKWTPKKAAAEAEQMNGDSSHE